MSQKTNKKAYGLNFYIIQKGEASYTPIGDTWESLSQNQKVDARNPKRIKVKYYSTEIEIKLLGFYIPQDIKAKKFAFIQHQNDYYVVRFGKNNMNTIREWAVLSSFFLLKKQYELNIFNKKIKIDFLYYICINIIHKNKYMKTKNVIFIVSSVIIIIGAIYFFSSKPAKDQTLPNKFMVKENVVSLVTSFAIEDDDNQAYGEISREILHLTTTFSYYNEDDKLVAKGKTELVSWGTKIDFYDVEDNYIGAIHENVVESMFKVYTSYTVLDKNKQEIAKSEKTDIVATDITLTGTDGKKIAKLERDVINLFSDTWTVEIFQRNQIDARILPIMIAYKTYSDNKKG